MHINTKHTYVCARVCVAKLESFQEHITDKLNRFFAKSTVKPTDSTFSSGKTLLGQSYKTYMYTVPHENPIIFLHIAHVV